MERNISSTSLHDGGPAMMGSLSDGGLISQVWSSAEIGTPSPVSSLSLKANFVLVSISIVLEAQLHLSPCHMK